MPAWWPGKQPGQHASQDLARANARLIAAAPDLLAALSHLTVAVGEADALQHAGLDVPAKVWANIYQTNLEARAAIAAATNQA